MLMSIVDFATMLIGAEGARLLREKRVKGDPAEQARQAPRRLPDRPRGAERLERKSTGKFIRAFHKANPMIETYPMC